uniref:Uncharacterized protein n=1 Tax=Rhizophagus irregularis (strain DAOM 181602 / DAOM 197198 / MUCL 43194) TaxID=747089 RepID=U9T5J4_RHIID
MWTFRKLREIIKTDQKEEYREQDSMSEKKSILDASHLTLIKMSRTAFHTLRIKFIFRFQKYYLTKYTSALKKDCQDRGCSSDNQEL